MNFIINIPIEFLILCVCTGILCLLGLIYIYRKHLKKNGLQIVSKNGLTFTNHLELFDNLLSGLIVFYHDKKQDNFIISRVNASVERIDQINGKNVVGTKLSSIYPFSNNNELMDMCYQVWETGVSEHKELCIQSSDDTSLRYRDYYIYKLTSGHAVVMFREISQNKRLEKALQEGQKKWKETYHRLKQIMPAGMISCDLDGRIVESNVSFQKMLGYNEKELSQMTHMEITGEEWHNFEAQYIPKQLENKGQSEVYHKKYIRKDNTSFKAEIQTYLIKDDNDKPVSMWSIIQDITEREQILESLHESRAYIENILTSMIDALIVINLDLTIQKVNRALIELTDFEEIDLIGNHISVLMKSVDKEDVIQDHIKTPWLNTLFSKLIQTKTLKNFEMIFSCKSGDPIPVNFFGSTMMDNNDEVVGFLGIARNIKDEKARRERLVQAEKFAALGEVIPGVGHELSQPLNVIKIINQSLLRDIEKDRFHMEDLQQDLNSVIDEVNKMSEIIDHMRIFARSSQNMQKMPVDMKTVIKAALRFFSQQLKNRTIEAKLDIQSNLPLVTADPARLEQMMVNLITNARDSLERSEKTEKIIHIKCYRSNEDNDAVFVAIEVSDNGKGLTEKLAKFIFDPHFTPGTPWNGTGMGIAISKKIVEEHEGRISMQNKKDEGTKFTILLPVKE
ncbi:PAS domain S-box [Candidatus Magnetomorum sp. HK-1]|nr:PAS domain S-box [Candidatus Magnetomorum sp. HK-1]